MLQHYHLHIISQGISEQDWQLISSQLGGIHYMSCCVRTNEYS